jgi:hypothetical protein
MPESSPSGIQPFRDFLQETRNQGAAAYLNTPTSRVAHSDALDEMRAHVLSHYEGVEAQHSFVDENGSIFDCIPIAQQPSLRGSSGDIPQAPDLPKADSTPRSAAHDHRRAVQLQPTDQADQFGNSMAAPPGTIPMLRVTLATLSRFQTLRQFMQKSPDGGARPPHASAITPSSPSTGGSIVRPMGGIAGQTDLRGADLRGADLRGVNLNGVDLSGADLRGADLRGASFGGAALSGADLAGANLQGAGPCGAAPLLSGGLHPAVTATHRWAHAYQNVANLGGHSYLNVWDPPIGANQIFSLSQHWYVGGSGAALQTAEVGWQVYPGMYGNTKPVFFIYWTADDYRSTGCYNLTCTAFVQTSSTWKIGGTLSPWSIAGGQQYEIQVAFFLYQGRWWLYIGGEAGSNAIGYYPATIYRGGAMASGASEIDYGGETVGTTSWPPMGSGAFANTGWQHAAYQRDIRYYPPGGGTTHASLTGSATSPCYTVSVARYAAPWNETIFFGGPGGTNC